MGNQQRTPCKMGSVQRLDPRTLTVMSTYGIVRSVMKVIELGRNALAPQIEPSKMDSLLQKPGGPLQKQNVDVLLSKQTDPPSKLPKKYGSICLHKSKQIKQLYLLGIPCRQIGTLIKYDEQAVRRLLKSMGVLRNTKPYQKCINHNWLDTVDTEEKAYFLGLLAADGWLDRNSLFISLQQADRELLEALQSRIVPFIPLAHYKAGRMNVDDSVRLVITSQRWRCRCEELGITPKKSLSMPNVCKNIPLDVRNHFVRGYFDGDGTVGVYWNKRLKKKFARVSFLGTKEFLTGVHSAIELPVGTVTIRPPEKIHRLTYSGKKRLLEISEYLYKDATIFLPRKRKRFVW